jgi:hypothetical protein
MESLVSDISAWDGKTANLLKQCMFNPFLFISGLSCPRYVQASFTLDCLAIYN